MSRNEHGSDTRLGDLLGRIQSGDLAAREELISESYERFRKRASKMLKSFPSVARANETGDVLHPVLSRLHRDIGDIKFESVRHFIYVVAQKIKWELLDLAKKQIPTPDVSVQNHVREDSTSGSGISLEDWSAFHKAVEELPDDTREVFCLRYYSRLTHQEIADLCELSVDQVKYLFKKAKRILRDHLLDDL